MEAPHDIDDERLHKELADYLSANGKAILAAWTQQVMREAKRGGAAVQLDRQDDVRDLSEMFPLAVEHLRNPGDQESFELLDQFVRQRYRVGRSAVQIARDLSLLKQVMIRSIEESQSFPPEMLRRLCDHIEDLMDELRLHVESAPHALREAQRAPGPSPQGERVARERADQLAAMLEITNAISTSLSIDEVYRCLAEQATSLIRYDWLTMALTGPEWKTVQIFELDSEKKEPSALVLQGPIKGRPIDWVIMHRKPLLCDDLTKETRFVEMSNLIDAGMRSYISLPLIVRDQVIGSLNFASRTPSAYSQKDLAMLLQIAGQIAIALENARMFQALKKRAGHLAILNEVAKHALSSLHLEELVQNVVDSVQRNFDFYDVSIFLVREDQGDLELAAQAGAYEDESPIGYHQAIGVGMVGWTAQHGDPLVANDVSQEPRRIIAFEGETLAASELCMPIKVDNRTVAVLNVECQVPNAFDAEDVTAMETVADLVATGIKNSQLYQCVLQEKAKLDDVVTAMGAGLTLIGANMELLWGNQTVFDWFGLDDESAGKPFYRVCCGRETLCDDCPVSRAMESGRQEVETTPFVTKDGVHRHLQHIVAPIRNDRGEVVQLLKLSLDVSEHVRQVQQVSLLYQLSEILQQAWDLEWLFHAVLTCATAGYGLGFNRAFLLLVDPEKNALVGRRAVGPVSHEEAARSWSEIDRDTQSLHDLLGPEAARRARGHLDEVVRQISVPLDEGDDLLALAIRERAPLIVEDAETDERVKDSLRQWNEARQFVVVPLVARDEAIGVILADNLYTGARIMEEDVHALSTFASQAALAISNVMAYRKVEEQVQKLQEAYAQLEATQQQLIHAEALATIGRMAAHVAHEIRNPLTTIGGFAHSILRKPDNQERCSRNARIIVKEVERLEQILANVMDFSKPDTPKLIYDNMNRIVKDVASFYEHEIESRGIDMILDLARKLPDTRFDPDQMRQVFINLIQNGVESMKHGGCLTLRTWEHNGEVFAEVQDTGEGIPPHLLDNVFEPFFSRKSGGTGLGLAVSQKIVIDHGGRLLVQSEKGKGSRFTVVIPIRPPREPNGALPTDAPS